MNDKLTIFLGKLQQVLNGLDEIYDMIGNNSSDQSNVDTLFEDYKHLIEENGKDMSDDAKINMINSYYDARQTRRRNNKLSKEELEKCLSEGKKVKEIAKMYNLSQPYVSTLKRKYGLETRKYKKGDK